MANLRVIKKDVDFLIGEVVSDCQVFLYINDGKKETEIVDIIKEAVSLRNAMYDRINTPDKSNIKGYYKKINKDLLLEVDQLFQKISDLAK